MSDYSSIFEDLKSVEIFDKSESIYDLSEEQNKIVMASSDENIIVNAGAGSGKTRILITRVARLIDQGADPKSIALLAFTKESAEEMKRRMKAMGISVGFVGTIHSLCYKHVPKSLRENGVLEEGQEDMIAEEILSENPSLKNVFKDPKEVINYLEKKRQECEISSFSENGTESLFEAYWEKLQSKCSIDFTGLMEYIASQLEAGKKKSTYKFILVDEAQDLTLLQERCLAYFIKPEGRFFFVGDPRQSIFSFRGKSSFNSKFFNLLSPKGANIYNLVDNHRSISSIVNLANEMNRIKDVPIQIPSKSYLDSQPFPVQLLTFPSVDEEVDFIQNTWRSLPIDKTFAVLYRTNRMVDAMKAAVSGKMKKLDLPSNLIITSVHDSKGCEFNTVLCAGMEADVFPHKKCYGGEAEERKLLYVAITRAMDKLYFASTMNRKSNGSQKICLPSVFLPEIETKLKAQKKASWSLEALPKM